MCYRYIHDPNKTKPVPIGFHRTAKGISNSMRTIRLYEKQIRHSLRIAGQVPCSSNLKLVIFTTCHVMKNHPEYAAAKHGDYFAARHLIRDIIQDEKLQKICSLISPNDVLLPIIQEQSIGHNRIAWALAKLLEKKTNATLLCSIHQICPFKHTGANGLFRILTPEIFAGSVQSKKKYILLDDHTTSGSTFASLTSYIETQAGEVKGLVSISASTKIPMADDGFIHLAPVGRFSRYGER